MTSKLKVLDLFSGIGGFSLGLERTGGFETVAFCEIEEFQRGTLRQNFPGIKIYDDVRSLSKHVLERDGISINAITAGFPCQDISLQGFRRGIVEGSRSGLWAEVARLADELRPEWIVLENVSALLGNGMGRVLGDLAEIGYDAEWDCVPASFIGAPHERDRIWIVANPSEVNGSTPNPKGIFAPSFWQTALSSSIGGSSVCKHEGAATVTLGNQSAVCSLDDGLSYSLVQRQLMAYGNTVHPVIPEIIGHAILQARAAA